MQLQNHGNGKIIARVCIFFTTTFVIIMAPTMKRKYNSKSILEKYQVLKEIGGKTGTDMFNYSKVPIIWNFG